MAAHFQKVTETGLSLKQVLVRYVTSGLISLSHFSLFLSMYTGSLHSMPGSASFEIYTISQTFGKGVQWKSA